LAADLRRLKNESPAGRIFSGAIETMPTILSESKKQMIDQRGKNILGIELELAHALRFLEGSKDIRLNAVLEVTDLPGMQNQRLGDLGLGARLEQSEMGELVAAVIAEDLKLRVIEKQMRAIAETGKSLLKTAHIPGILDGIKSGMIGLKGEDIDVIGVNSSGEEIVLGPLDRNIVHLYFAPDGTFMRSADEKLFLKTGAKQLLHRVANILVTTPDGRLILRQGFKENGGAGTTNVFGGHVLASVSYAETAEKELKEELGFPADYRLQGKFELLGAEGQFYAIRGWEPDRITFYRYIPSEEEIRIIESESKRLNARREEIGEAAFAGELKAIREKGAGGGEVWAIHFVPLGHFSEAQKEINPGRTLLGFISDQGLFKTLPAGFGMGKSVPIVHERPWRAKIDKSIAASVEAAVPIMRAAVLNAGTRIEVWRQKLDTLKKFDKTDKTIVTEADLDVESALLDELQKTLSFNFKVIAEEKEGELGERIAKINGQNKESPWTVVIDPIDGTQEFVDRSSQYFGALLSLQFEGEVLAAFMVCPEYRLSGEQEGGTLFEGVRVNGRFAVHRIKDGKILTSEVITPQAEKPLRDYQGGTVLFQLPLTPEEFNTAGFMTEVKKTPSTGLMLAMLAYRGGGSFRGSSFCRTCRDGCRQFFLRRTSLAVARDDI
jgi:8-oxo-dGTP pyrophosphatase MutT (NUDIX family)